jgi:hypothetical protein
MYSNSGWRKLMLGNFQKKQGTLIKLKIGRSFRMEKVLSCNEGIVD